MITIIVAHTHSQNRAELLLNLGMLTVFLFSKKKIFSLRNKIATNSPADGIATILTEQR